MNKYSISLEKSFLNRQFRAIRDVYEGQSPRLSPPPVLPVSNIAPLIPALAKPKPVIIFEQKKPFIPITNHIDLLNTTKIAKPVLEVSSPPAKRLRFRKGKWRAVLFGGITVVCLILLTILFAPTLYYTLFPGDPVPIKAATNGTPLGGQFAKGSSRVVSQVPTPAYDANLPDGTWLIIPKIGVNTQIIDSASSDEALNKGVWRVPDFGTPTDLSKPMILAAHRYGWKAWWNNGNQYWRYHSFYLLPDLVPGDIVEVIANHRKYTYEIYAGEQGENITDYNADLILYTCKFLDSPLRFFRYARLVDPNHPVSFSRT